MTLSVKIVCLHIDVMTKSQKRGKDMSEKNPKVIMLMDKQVQINDFIENMKKDWEYNCNLEVSQEQKFVNYAFEYEGMVIACSVFDTRFPEEELEGDIAQSIYGSDLKDIYNEHKCFVIAAVIGDLPVNINKAYSLFTRVVMAFQKNVSRGLIYDMDSRQAIQTDVYMKMFENMKNWYREGKDIFPTDWYVNYRLYENNGKLNGFTLGFEKFNDYEIEIYDADIEIEELVNILTFIVINVISMQDKIHDRDLIPVPLGEKYSEAIVKLNKSNILDKETLVIIF